MKPILLGFLAAVFGMIISHEVIGYAQDPPKGEKADSLVHIRHGIDFFNAQLEQLEAERKRMQEAINQNELQQARIVGQRDMLITHPDSLYKFRIQDARNIRAFINGRSKN